MKIPFLKCLICIYRSIAKVLNDQSLSTEWNLGDWFLSYVLFKSGSHSSEQTAE